MKRQGHIPILCAHQVTGGIVTIPWLTVKDALFAAQLRFGHDTEHSGSRFSFERRKN